LALFLALRLTNRAFSFALLPVNKQKNKRTLFFVASTQQEARAWIDAINVCTLRQFILSFTAQE
jgi:hypothetical protein